MLCTSTALIADTTFLPNLNTNYTISSPCTWDSNLKIYSVSLSPGGTFNTQSGMYHQAHNFASYKSLASPSVSASFDQMTLALYACGDKYNQATPTPIPQTLSNTTTTTTTTTQCTQQFKDNYNTYKANLSLWNSNITNCCNHVASSYCANLDSYAWGMKQAVTNWCSNSLPAMSSGAYCTSNYDFSATTTCMDGLYTSLKC